MTILKIKDLLPNCIDGRNGWRLGRKISEDSPFTLDFSGVTGVSESFVMQTLAVLLESSTIESVNSRIALLNFPPTLIHTWNAFAPIIKESYDGIVKQLFNITDQEILPAQDFCYFTDRQLIYPLTHLQGERPEPHPFDWESPRRVLIRQEDKIVFSTSDHPHQIVFAQGTGRFIAETGRLSRNLLDKIRSRATIYYRRDIKKAWLDPKKTLILEPDPSPEEIRMRQLWDVFYRKKLSDEGLPSRNPKSVRKLRGKIHDR